MKYESHKWNEVQMKNCMEMLLILTVKVSMKVTHCNTVWTFCHSLIFRLLRVLLSGGTIGYLLIRSLISLCDDTVKERIFIKNGQIQPSSRLFRLHPQER